MKKFSFLAAALAVMVFAACGGNKKTSEATETETKSFEQEQVEASIKMHVDSLASEIGKLKQFPFICEGADGKLALTKEEKQVKPDYLLSPAAADEATTLAEKYRLLSALHVDKKVAALYEMPTEDYDKAITKLAADINDPSFQELGDSVDAFETTQILYDAMNKNGRINYFWQLAAATLVEQLYVMTQNSDKFLSVFDDKAAQEVSFRITLIADATKRLAEFDEDLKPIADAIDPLAVLNAMSVDELKAQVAEAKENIGTARAALVK